MHRPPTIHPNKAINIFNSNGGQNIIAKQIYDFIPTPTNKKPFLSRDRKGNRNYEKQSEGRDNLGVKQLIIPSLAACQFQRLTD